MDEPRLRSFLLARGLLERARDAVDGTVPGDMAAVVLYDLAVETGAKAAAAAHPPPASFPGERYLLTKRPTRSLRRDLPLPAVLDELLASCAT